MLTDQISTFIKQTSIGQEQKFKKILSDNGIDVEIYESNGKDIDAACGQSHTSHR